MIDRKRTKADDIYSVFLLVIAVLFCSFFYFFFFFFFFNDTATTEIYTNLNTHSLHDALPISDVALAETHQGLVAAAAGQGHADAEHQRSEEHTSELQSHSEISYAVFCLK